MSVLDNITRYAKLVFKNLISHKDKNVIIVDKNGSIIMKSFNFPVMIELK